MTWVSPRPYQVLPKEVDQSHSGIHGTVSHMPPEAMSETIFSRSTDVYSFGILLWELVSQDAPFKGMAAHQVVEAVVQHGLRPQWPEQVFPPLRILGERCWSSDPKLRPSFSEVGFLWLCSLHFTCSPLPPIDPPVLPVRARRWLMCCET